MTEKNVCLTCGFEFTGPDVVCPLCSGAWEAWEMMFSPLPLAEIRAQVAGWIGQLPHPVVLEISARTDGVMLRMYGPPGVLESAAASWAAMTHQQTRWRPVDHRLDVSSSTFVLTTNEILPTLSPSVQGDPFLAIASTLKNLATGKNVYLRFWLVGRDTETQEYLRQLYAYAYSTESGVSDGTPNPWGMQLTLLKTVLAAGMGIASIGAATAMLGWLHPAGGVLAVAAGVVLTLVAGLGTRRWMQWRSVPKEVVQARIQDALLKVAITINGVLPEQAPHILAGHSTWKLVANAWPGVKLHAMPLPAGEIAALVSPPEKGEGSGIIHRDVWQDTISPPPSPDLVKAPLKVGVAVATHETLGIDPDGHCLIVGGTRTGKSSVTWQILRQLVMQGNDAPGIFLVDPHLSLADAFLNVIDTLPSSSREKAVQRLRIITPDEPELLPLNLLAVPDFAWAGNAIIQIGKRIWSDYWGPRMQAALLGLFRIAHAWNQAHPESSLGLLHVVFAAFNVGWRHEAMALLSPSERMGVLALDALLGQSEGNNGSWQNKWTTEVVSPVLSKTMALELSEWLYASMHQPGFVDIERWIQERAWIVLRLPSGMGRESVRLIASVVYNVFDAAYRRITANSPIPYYFVIDETQEIGAGMQLESMLSEGAKFGARMFILTQSLSMLRRVEGFDAVVQALLANTSTQMFFSPDPEDADIIRDTLNASARYGALTLDLPTLQCWLRARINRRWQPPTVMQAEYPPRPDPERIHNLIREVIAAHPDEYAHPTDWRAGAVAALQEIVPPTAAGYLSHLFTPEKARGRRGGETKNVKRSDIAANERNLGNL